MEESNEARLECGRRVRIVGGVRQEWAIAVTDDIWANVFEPISGMPDAVDQLNDTLAAALFPLLPSLSSPHCANSIDFTVTLVCPPEICTEVQLNVTNVATEKSSRLLYLVDFSRRQSVFSGDEYGPV